MSKKVKGLLVGVLMFVGQANAGWEGVLTYCQQRGMKKERTEECPWMFYPWSVVNDQAFDTFRRSLSSCATLSNKLILHAVQTGQIKCFAYLICLEPDLLNTKNEQGQTLREIAKNFGKTEMVQLIDQIVVDNMFGVEAIVDKAVKE